jgi:hypothetical protein
MDATLAQNNPLAPYCREWMAKINAGKDAKRERFGKFADEAMKFFDGSHDWMWQEQYAMSPGGFLEKGAAQMPTFRMTVNRVFEAMALYGPALYHQNPNILVTPTRTPQWPPEVLGIDPNDEMQLMQYQALMSQQELRDVTNNTYADFYSHYLNWLTVEGDLKSHSRRAVTEAVVKGMGLLWVEMYTPPASQISYPRARYESVDNLVIDPDATCWEDIQWVALRCIHPRNVVEQKYGLEPGTIKGHMQSLGQQETKRGKNQARQNQQHGDTFDLCEYWQIYSKNGFGDRLNTLQKKDRQPVMEFVGDFAYIVITKDLPFPLNVPPEVLQDQEEVFNRAQWPIPFYLDVGCGGGWPFAKLCFYDKPGSVWPISLIKPAIGELRFVNWCMSFLADKVAASCTTYVAVAKSAGAEIQKQLNKALDGGPSPFTVIELSDILGKGVNDVVSFLQAPDFSESIWRMVAETLELIDKRTGLTELIYGLTSTQMRSATEADVKNQNISIRPDDMANKTEDWLSEVAVKQMQAADWMLEGKDVAPVLGDVGGHLWDQKRAMGDVESIVRDFRFRIEAGTARKPNKANKARLMHDFAQVALPIFQEFAMAGQVGPLNQFLADWCKANDLAPDGYLIQAPQGPSPEEQKVQAELQLKEAEMQMKGQEMAAELEMKKEEMDMTLQHEEEMHQQEMEFEREKHGVEMKQEKAAAKQDIEIGEKKLALQKKQIDLKAKAASQQSKTKPAKKG